MNATTTGQDLRPALLLAALLRHWRWTVVFPFVAAVLTAILVLVLPPRFTSESSFTAQSRSDVRLPSGFASLAGELGIGLGGGGTTSPKFYADLARARAVLEPTLEHPLDAVAGHPRLIDWLDITGATRADSVDEALKAFSRSVVTDIDRETGLIKMSVSLRDPRVAAEASSAIIAQLDLFNTARRRAQARQRLEFIDGRVREGEQAVRAAEDDLERFYATNRLRDSPSLVMQEQRLQARVSLLREVVLTLRREAESAGIEAVNDTPVLTVVDAPSVPLRRSFPRRKVSVILATFVAGVLGAAMALLREYFTAPATADHDGMDAVRQAWVEARRGLRSLLRLRARA